MESVVAAEAGNGCSDDGWGAGSLGIEERAAFGGAGGEGAEGDDGLLRRGDGGGSCLREDGERAEDESREEGGGDIHGCRVQYVLTYVLRKASGGSSLV